MKPVEANIITNNKYIQTTEFPFERSSKTFYNVPDSPASNYIMETLNAGKDLDELQTRKLAVTRSTSIEVSGDKKGRQISFTNPDYSVSIQLADIDKLAGSNKSVKKLFLLTMIKANEQALHGGTLTRDHVSFPLQELVDIEFYSSLRSARTGFLAGTDVLTDMKIKGQLKHKGKEGGPSVDVLEVLFTGANITRGQCTIYLNPRINWGFLSQYYTILPQYYFSLSNRGSELLYYIFYLARQNVDKIKHKGRFNIGFRAIQQRLMLPSEVGNREPGKTIIRPIEEAVEQIETLHNKFYGNMELQLLPVYDVNANIRDILDHGYLEVTLEGTIADVFINISKDKEKQIKAARERQQKITDAAKEKALINLLEKENARAIEQPAEAQPADGA